MTQGHTVQCACGHRMRVKKKHVGHMGKCTMCAQPVYVTRDSVWPPLDEGGLDGPRHFEADEVPAHWRKGDLFMETYEVMELVGKGGMGLVHRVYHKGWGVDLAVKTPRPELVPEHNWEGDFERECETWVGLDPHPNVCNCYYVRRLGGIPRLFMEFVPGGSLSRWIRKGFLYQGEPQEALVRILDIAIQFAWGLHHAHAQGLAHRDVKPANVLLTREGVAKVTDFGLVQAVKTMGDGHERSRLYLTSGTPQYSAPEQLREDRVSPQSDVWSFAASLAEMFLGSPTWDDGASLRDVLDRYHAGEISDVAVPRMPRAVAALMQRCLDENPSRRPNSMREVAAILRDVYERASGGSYLRHEPNGSLASAGTLSNRAVSVLDLGKGDEADDLWNRARSLDPGHIESIYNQRLHHWRSGKITDIQFIRSLRRLCINHGETWLPRYLLGRALLEWGDFRTALEVLKEIGARDRERREVHIAIAIAREREQHSRRLVREFHGHREPVRCVCLSADGWHGVSGTESGCVTLWETTAGESQMVFRGHGGCVHSVCMSTDERWILSGGADGLIKLWDAHTGDCVVTLSGHLDAVRSVRLSENARTALSGSTDGTLRVWDISSGRCVKVLEGHGAGVNAVDLSRCARYALSGSRDTTLKYWDLASGKCVSTFAGHKRRVHSVALSRDRKRAVSAGRDAQVRLWDVATGECLRAFAGHRTEAYTVSLSENQEYVLSASRTGTIKLWDSATGQCLRSFIGSAPACLSRNGRRAFSGDESGMLRVWAVACDVKRVVAPYMMCRLEV